LLIVVLQLGQALGLRDGGCGFAPPALGDQGVLALAAPGAQG